MSLTVHVARLSFDVPLAGGQRAVIAADLHHAGSLAGKPLQVAVHGGNYNRKYWDIPAINGQEYSYARYMVERGHAVLAIDQLGTGESSRPAGDAVTLAETATALHGVLAAIRRGEHAVLAGASKIILVGHSLGCMTIVAEQAAHGDADAVVATGAGHVPHALPMDPGAIGALMQHPYFRLPAEVRRAAFYHLPGVDPDVVAHDLAHLDDDVARGFIGSSLPVQYDDERSGVGRVRAKVLVQLGEHDAIAPAALAREEGAHWASAASVTVQALARMGHIFNGHLERAASFAGIDAWLRAQVG